MAVIHPKNSLSMLDLAEGSITHPFNTNTTTPQPHHPTTPPHPTPPPHRSTHPRNKNTHRYWMKAWRAAMMFQRAWNGYYAIVKLRKFRMARRIQCKWRRYWALKTVENHLLFNTPTNLTPTPTPTPNSLLSPRLVGPTHLPFQAIFSPSLCLHVWVSEMEGIRRDGAASEASHENVDVHVCPVMLRWMEVHLGSETCPHRGNAQDRGASGQGRRFVCSVQTVGYIHRPREAEERNAPTDSGASAVRYVDHIYESGPSQEKNVPSHVEFHQGTTPSSPHQPP